MFIHFKNQLTKINLKIQSYLERKILLNLSKSHVRPITKLLLTNQFKNPTKNQNKNSLKIDRLHSLTIGKIEIRIESNEMNHENKADPSQDKNPQ